MSEKPQSTAGNADERPGPVTGVINIKNAGSAEEAASLLDNLFKAYKDDSSKMRSIHQLLPAYIPRGHKYFDLVRERLSGLHPSSL